MGQAGEQLKKDPLGFVVNAGLQYGTWGLLGYEDGKVGKGMTTRAVDEGLGEITGRNMGRDQIAAADARVKAENAQRITDQANLNEQNRINDINASMAAAGSRKTAAARAGVTTPSSSVTSMGGDEVDFLGI